MLEKTVDQAIKRYVDAKGGLYIKLIPLHFIGLPDRLVILPFKPMFFVEVKRPGGEPSKLQLAVHRKLRSLGVKVFVADNINRFKDDIQTL